MKEETAARPGLLRRRLARDLHARNHTKEINRAGAATRPCSRSVSRTPSPTSRADEYQALLQALHAERDVQTRIVVNAIRSGPRPAGSTASSLAKALTHGPEPGCAARPLVRPRRPRRSSTSERSGRWFEERLRPTSSLLGVGKMPKQEAREKLLVAALHAYAVRCSTSNQMARSIFGALDDATTFRVRRDRCCRRVTFSSLSSRSPTTTGMCAGARSPILRWWPRADTGTCSSSGTAPTRAIESARKKMARCRSPRAPRGREPAGRVPGRPRRLVPDVLEPGSTTPRDVAGYFRAYELAGAKPAWAYLVDGGVLDDKPFGPVLRAIKQRPRAATKSTSTSSTSTHPKPRLRPVSHRHEADHRDAQHAQRSLPASESILDELHDLLKQNADVRAVHRRES